MTEGRLSAASPPRRRIDRETTPGRCGNLDYCSIGMQRVLVRVPISAPFICPECGGRLRAPGGTAGAKGPWVLPALRLGVLTAFSVAALAVGYTIGHVQPMVRQVAQDFSRRAGTGVVAAGIAVGLNAPPAAPPKPAPAPPPAAAPPAKIVALPPPTVVVEERPFSAHAPAADSPPPDRLGHESRFGQVTVECTLLAGQTRAVCATAGIRGADAFSEAAIAWLQTLNVSYRSANGPARDHRWRIVFQDFAAASAAEPPVQ